VKRLLVYLSPERQCSLFDIIVAYDAGADAVIPYSNIKIEEVRDIVYGCCFTRHPRDLKNTSVFVGGYSIEKAEELASEALKVLNELPAEFKVNIALDPNGAYTTASACVAKIASAINLEGLNATVLAGTGPVGVSISRLLVGLGMKVRVTSRRLDRAEEVAKSISGKASGFQVDTPAKVAESVKDADVVVSAGPPGVELMSESVWKSNPRIKILADVNAVPPYGIQGVKPKNDGSVQEEKKCFGALTIGSLKMMLHQNMIKQMFNQRDLFFNLERIHRLHENSLSEQ
jgi:hypothetical protein